MRRGGCFADRRAAVGAGVLAPAVLAALLAPLLAGDPIAQRDVVATRFLPPFATDPCGAFHLLGTDRFGRDVWARLIYGARVSLGVGSLAVLLSVVIGVAVGAAAGFWRGWVGVGLLGLTDFALALPRVVLLLLLASLWQPSAGLVILVLGLTGWMTDRATGACARCARCRCGRSWRAPSGWASPGPRILLRHILPNALTPVIVAAALGLGNAILLEAGLSFLGLGVQPPTPSWGNLIASGQRHADQRALGGRRAGGGAGARRGGGDTAGRRGAGSAARCRVRGRGREAGAARGRDEECVRAWRPRRAGSGGQVSALPARPCRCPLPPPAACPPTACPPARPTLVDPPLTMRSSRSSPARRRSRDRARCACCGRPGEPR